MIYTKRSVAFQFTSLSNTSLNIKNIESFYKVKPSHFHFDIKHSKQENEYMVGQFNYKSSVQSGDSRNDSVTGELFLHKMKMHLMLSLFTVGEWILTNV